jgi:hypothetical protein
VVRDIFNESRWPARQLESARRDLSHFRVVINSPTRARRACGNGREPTIGECVAKWREAALKADKLKFRSWVLHFFRGLGGECRTWSACMVDVWRVAVTDEP